MRRVFPLLLLALAGCDLSMTRQAKHEAQSSPSWWADGPAATSPPDGTIARDEPAREEALARPPAVTPALLARGQERYTIFCTPCHGTEGRGNGIVVARGFPQPPSYLEQRLVAAPPARVVDVITRGYGIMYDFADRIPPADRWAIAAYVKALQRAGLERTAAR